ncbi:MAG: GNAT family N-acetyltransferase [Ruminococcus sp.]|nr:GNAT family N-acetyltransferase [Ruminococcus sp.]
MKITFRRIKKGSPDIGIVKNLYTKAFPAEERAPFLLLLLRSSKPGIDFWSVDCNGRWAGMLYVVSHKDLSYLFYLAVDKDLRGMGVGSAILQAARKRYAGRRLFLAIEELDEKAENYPERIRRRDFYVRNGFTELHRKLREGRVLYDILGCGGDVKPAEYKALIKCFSGSILLKFFTMEFVD